MPFRSNWAGWIFTEMGRQPWIAHPIPEFEGTNDPLGRDKIHMIVDFGVSNHSAATVWASVITFTLLYGVLAVIWFWLITSQTLADPLPRGSSTDIAASEYGPSDRRHRTADF